MVPTGVHDASPSKARIRPVSTLPGPVSRKRLKPSASRLWISVTHCTLDTICSTHSRFASAPLAMRLPVTLAYTGCAGSWNVKPATTSANCTRADSISGE